jgi:hypothetical protein
MISLSFISYFFAFFSVCSIWFFDQKKFAAIFFALALATAYITGIMSLEALAITLVYLALNWLYFKVDTSLLIKILTWIAIFIIAYFLASNWVVGFKSWKLISEEIISEGAEPYNLVLHFDAIIASMGILLFAFAPIRRLSQYKLVALKILPVVVVIIISLALFALGFNVVKVSPKVPDFWLIWLFSNLIITCVVEETIFRLFLQNTLSYILMSYRFRAFVSILVSSLFYAIYYTPIPMFSYITLLLLSSCYGYVYHVTKRIEASIILHFIVNSIHFFFFTYPQLQIS